MPDEISCQPYTPGVRSSCGAATSPDQLTPPEAGNKGPEVSSGDVYATVAGVGGLALIVAGTLHGNVPLVAVGVGLLAGACAPSAPGPQDPSGGIPPLDPPDGGEVTPPPSLKCQLDPSTSSLLLLFKDNNGRVAPLAVSRGSFTTSPDGSASINGYAAWAPQVPAALLDRSRNPNYQQVLSQVADRNAGKALSSLDYGCPPNIRTWSSLGPAAQKIGPRIRITGRMKGDTCQADLNLAGTLNNRDLSDPTVQGLGLLFYGIFANPDGSSTMAGTAANCMANESAQLVSSGALTIPDLSQDGISGAFGNYTWQLVRVGRQSGSDGGVASPKEMTPEVISQLHAGAMLVFISPDQIAVYDQNWEQVSSFHWNSKVFQQF